MRKLNIYGTEYFLSLNPQPEVLSLMDELGNIFDSLVKEMASKMADNDLVRFALQSRCLDYPTSPPVMPRGELNAERIMGEMERVLSPMKET